MKGWLHERGLFWKEWREKRWLLALFALAMILIPLSLMAFGGLHRAGDVDEAIFPVLGLFSLGVLALGAVLLSREEEDPARAFLYTLPLSRGRILATKLGALASQWLVLALLLLVFAALLLLGREVPQNAQAAWALEQSWRMVFVFLLWSPLMLLLAGIFSLHLRSILVTLVLTLVFCVPVLAVLYFGAAFGLPRRYFCLGLPNAFLFGSSLLAAAMLAAWLFFLFCRTAIQELGNTTRVLLALLFGVGAVEVIFTVFLCNYRDLIFILFGI